MVFLPFDEAVGDFDEKSIEEFSIFVISSLKDDSAIEGVNLLDFSWYEVVFFEIFTHFVHVVFISTFLFSCDIDGVYL